jgi:hypothetical protein
MKIGGVLVFVLSGMAVFGAENLEVLPAEAVCDRVSANVQAMCLDLGHKEIMCRQARHSLHKKCPQMARAATHNCVKGPHPEKEGWSKCFPALPGETVGETNESNMGELNGGGPTMTSYGQGYCNNEYLRGWDGKGTASQDACNLVCLAETDCTYAAFNKGKTCSRYKGSGCDLNGVSDHFTFKKSSTSANPGFDTTKLDGPQPGGLGKAGFSLCRHWWNAPNGPIHGYERAARYFISRMERYMTWTNVDTGWPSPHARWIGHRRAGCSRVPTYRPENNVHVSKGQEYEHGVAHAGDEKIVCGCREMWCPLGTAGVGYYDMGSPCVTATQLFGCLDHWGNAFEKNCRDWQVLNF